MRIQGTITSLGQAAMGLPRAHQGAHEVAAGALGLKLS
jgi:hypothetical protein